jgi:hypothetical protein
MYLSRAQSLWFEIFLSFLIRHSHRPSASLQFYLVLPLVVLEVEVQPEPRLAVQLAVQLAVALVVAAQMHHLVNHLEVQVLQIRVVLQLQALLVLVA